MIIVCPNCGTKLPEVLIDGLANCTHCHQVFFSSIFNQLLAASWLVRNKKLNTEELIAEARIGEVEAKLVYSLVEENCYSHDEVQKVLRQLY